MGLKIMIFVVVDWLTKYGDFIPMDSTAKDSDVFEMLHRHPNILLVMWAKIH